MCWRIRDDIRSRSKLFPFPCAASAKQLPPLLCLVFHHQEGRGTRWKSWSSDPRTEWGWLLGIFLGRGAGWVGAWGKDHTLKLACLQCKNSPDWESFCGIVISEPTVKHVQHVVLLHTFQHLKSSPWIFSSNQKLSPGNITQSTGSQKEYSNTHSSIWKKKFLVFWDT